MDRIVFDLQLFKDIENTANNTLVSGTAGNDEIHNNCGDDVTIDAGFIGGGIHTSGKRIISNSTIR